MAPSVSDQLRASTSEGPMVSESVPFEFTGLPVQSVRSVPREANVGNWLISRTTTTGPMFSNVYRPQGCFEKRL